VLLLSPKQTLCGQKYCASASKLCIWLCTSIMPVDGDSRAVDAAKAGVEHFSCALLCQVQSSRPLSYVL